MDHINSPCYNSNYTYLLVLATPLPSYGAYTLLTAITCLDLYLQCLYKHQGTGSRPEPWLGVKGAEPAL